MSDCFVLYLLLTCMKKKTSGADKFTNNTMWKRIKRAIRIARRNSRARRQRKRTSEILLAIFTLTNCGTLQELEYHTGYYAGTADQAAAVGEITREQRGQILRVLHYISAGERERLENE